MKKVKKIVPLMERERIKHAIDVAVERYHKTAGRRIMLKYATRGFIAGVSLGLGVGVVIGLLV